MEIREEQRNSREFNINIDFKDVFYEDLYWIELAQVRIQRWDIVNTVIKLQVT
jgi:hypothetical protein